MPPNVLQLLTRLRQIACLSTLVPPDYIEVRATTLVMKYGRAVKRVLLQTLQQEEERHAPLANISNEARKALIFKLKAAIDDATECPVRSFCTVAGRFYRTHTLHKISLP